MKIRLFACNDVKKARIEMWKHILKNWIKLKFKHLPQECYAMDSKDHLSGRITKVECECGKCFYQESGWD